MILYPLILGILSMLSPWLGLVLLLSFAAKSITLSLTKPLQSLVLFFLAPVTVLILDSDPAIRIMALDAIFGAGVVILVFLVTLKKNHVLSESLMLSFLAMAAYGILRFQFFGAYQNQLFDQGIATLKQQFSTMLDLTVLDQMLPIWKSVLPAVWIVSQGLALLTGYLIFIRLLQVPNTLQNLRFPALYNLLVIAVLPLYLFEQTKVLSINALIALCFIPLLQGISVMWNRLGIIFNNRILIGILMIIITLYANILLVLLGFADMWLSQRNSIPGGTTA